MGSAGAGFAQGFTSTLALEPEPIGETPLEGTSMLTQRPPSRERRLLAQFAEVNPVEAFKMLRGEEKVTTAKPGEMILGPGGIQHEVERRLR